MDSKVLPEELHEELFKDRNVVAVLIFGSYARGEKNRDIDVCIVLDKKYSNMEMSRKMLHYSTIAPNDYDIHIFQQLPIYIRKRILKDGKVIICKDEDLLYEIAFSTIKEFGFYKKIYDLYLSKVKNG